MFMIDVGTLYWESKIYIRTAVLAYAPFTKLMFSGTTPTRTPLLSLARFVWDLVLDHVNTAGTIKQR